jgi:type IX secretion system PorP/SprF family membrane protein
MKKIVYSLILIAAAGRLQAQDIHFSQFFESPMLRNPALTGIFSGDYRVSANYRSQWGSFSVPFQTALITGESKALLREDTKDYLSFGLTAVYDKAGSIDFTSITTYGAVNYNKALGYGGNTYLSVGLGLGYIQRSFDITKMRFANQFSGGSFSSTTGSGESANYGVVRHFDVSGGTSLSGSFSPRVNYYFGAAAYHVSKPKESYGEETMIRLTTRWDANFGLSARLGQGFGLTVHANYQSQVPYQETIFGGLVSHDFHARDNTVKINFAAGCFYRLNDAIIPMVRAEWEKWTVTASYDVTASKQRAYLQGFAGYEFSLSMRGSYPHKESNLRCPRFELLDAELDLQD